MVTSGDSDCDATQPPHTESRPPARSREVRLAGAFDALDHASVWVERPVRRLAGSARLNPLPHAGTISVFLLGVVVVSGLYITLFFEYGHVASYEAVASMEGHAIQRVVRALHRYSSAALVLTTLVHGWRIFTARRFVGRQRRWRWASGVSALVLVWLAGVTGYWLIWDVRAQALNELVIGFVGRTSAGAGFAVDQLGVLGGRSGSGFLLVMWFVHLLLTAAIGYFMYRHVRRSKLPWLPPRHWMALMGGALIIVSLAVPVGMLPAAQPDRLVGEIPLDPFVLFLLPPMLSEARWLVLALVLVLFVVALALPRLLRQRDPDTIVIDEAACTGCELCVVDCPYEALRMVDPAPGSWPGPSAGPGDGGGPGGVREAIAVVDAQRCVSCGICLGSCAFGAIDLPGWDPTPPLEVEGRTVVIACDRHLPADAASLVGPSAGVDTAGPENGIGTRAEAGPVVHAVRCAGAMAPDTIRRFSERGAAEVQVVGCAPHECRYGIGNQLAAQRLAGERRPHPAAKFARETAQDWVSTDRFEQALRTPGEHPSADGSRSPANREALIGAGLITVVTAVGVALATGAPFDSGADGVEARIVVDHLAGRALQSNPEAGPVGPLSRIDLELDGRSIATVAGRPGDHRWAEIVDVGVDSDVQNEADAGADDRAENGAAALRAYSVEDGQRILLLEREVAMRPGNRLLVDVTDVAAAPTVADGRRIFSSRLGGCEVCHSVSPGDDGVGPSLAGVASVAGSRVEGLSAEQYLRQSILLPDQYVVEGWPAGQMLPIYRDRLTDAELDALISYLMTLEEP